MILGDTVRRRVKQEFKIKKTIELEWCTFLKMMVPKSDYIPDELITVTPENIEELKKDPEVY